MAGIYLHIPFCHQACHYCDFHFSVNLKPINEMYQAILTELDIKSKGDEREVIDTIYFGGGTPSILPPQQIQGLIDQVRSKFLVSNNLEITLEANPEDVTHKNAEQWQAAGVNRLSIGVQTFDSDQLKVLNRSHDKKQATTSFKIAQEIGIKNISGDLIFAQPDISDETFLNDLGQMLDLEPTHISIYGLTIEPQTVFGRWLEKGRISAVDDETYERQYTTIHKALTSHGYDHYEVSNFGLPGFWSRHNTSYWKQVPFIGIGPGAHSYDGQIRKSNVRNNHQYIKSLSTDKVPEEIEQLTPADVINEHIMTSLRTSWGLNLAEIDKNYHIDLRSTRRDQIDELIKDELVELNCDNLQPTLKGYLLADEICLKLFVED